MMSWVAVGREARGFVGFRVTGSAVQAQAEGSDAGQVLTQLNAGDLPVLRIGVGDAAALPAPIVPTQGQTLAALSQDMPADLISAWVRLWIAGYLADHPNWDGLVCALHGDVVHWLHVSADEVVSSATSLTPRFFAALSMIGEAAPDEAAMADTLSRPERLMIHLRAAEVRGDAGACLGHFIGADLAATRAYWLGQQAVVIGDGAMAAAYAQGLAGQGVPVDVVRPQAVLAKGVVALGHSVFRD
jgi:hypothetical protein